MTNIHATRNDLRSCIDVCGALLSDLGDVSRNMRTRKWACSEAEYCQVAPLRCRKIVIVKYTPNPMITSAVIEEAVLMKLSEMM
jgi:hypothetical protein